MATYHLHRWCIVTNDDPYTPPEARKIYLWGFRDQEEKSVKTSYVVAVNGREVHTKSGSIYILEEVDLEYLKYLEETGRTYDPENPIKNITG